MDDPYVEKEKPLPPEYWYCLCHTHVHQGTYISGIVGSACTLLFFLYMCFDTSSWELVSLCVPPIGAYALLMLGQRKEIVGLYWPHLIINCSMGTDFQSVMVLGYLTFIVLMGLQVKETYDTVLPANLPPQQLAHLHHVGTVFYIKHAIAVLLALLLTALTCYILMVTYRGFRYVHEVLHPEPEDLSPELRAQVRDFVRRQQESAEEANRPDEPDTESGEPNSTSTPVSPRHTQKVAPAVYKI